MDAWDAVRVIYGGAHAHRSRVELLSTAPFLGGHLRPIASAISYSVSRRRLMSTISTSSSRTASEQASAQSPLRTFHGAMSRVAGVRRRVRCHHGVEHRIASQRVGPRERVRLVRFLPAPALLRALSAVGYRADRCERGRSIGRRDATG